MRRVERVQDVPTGDRAGDDREVIAEVERAALLQGDVRDVGPGKKAAGVGTDELVVARGDVRVDDAKSRSACLDLLDVVRVGLERRR